MKTKAAKTKILLLAVFAFFALAPFNAMRSMLLPALAASEEKISTQVLFDRDIRPIFATHCIGCHGEKRQSGGLRLDAKAFAMRGGQNGSVIVPGKATESRLYNRVIAEKDNERMPPVGERLNSNEIAILKSWIDAGAAWPETAGDQATIRDKRLDHWAWQPIKRPAVPSLVYKIRDSQSAIRNRRIRNPIDAFISAKLAQAGLR